MDLYLGQAKDIILGQDFLTWLWFKSETANGTFRTSDGVDFALHVEQRISVQGGEGDTMETATVSGAVSQLREARLGLSTGKKVNKMLIRVERDMDEWHATLKAEDFSFTAVKTPKVETARDDDDPDGVFLEKIYLIERLLAFIDELYARFIEVRLSPAWSDEEHEVRAWLRKQAA
jgi:hypothetical protein